MLSLIRSGLILFLSLLFILSCTDKNKTEKPDVVTVTDTTSTGKQIAEISLKIGKEPSNAALYHERAQLHLSRNDVKNALLDMVKVTELDTVTAPYFVTLADVYFASGAPGKSKAALEKAVSIDPENLAAQEKLAELYFYVQEYDKSIAHLDNVLKKDIRNAKAYFMKGMNFKEKGDTSRAISSFQTAIEQRYNYYAAYQQLGIIFSAKNDKLALQYFDGALRIDPKSEEALYGKGMYYQETAHDYDKAIQEYTKITELNPINASAHFALGYIHYQYLKVYGEAVKHYTKAMDANPQWPQAVYNRGLAYESMGDVNAAKKDYELALKLQPDYEMPKLGLERIKNSVK